MAGLPSNMTKIIQKKAFTFLILISHTLLFGQSKEITTIVVDKLTNEPLIGVNIEKGNRHFITNAIGQAVLIGEADELVTFSYVGYPKTSLSFQNVPDTLFLEQSMVLKEAVVFGDSYLLGILHNSFNSIEENYPQEKSFIRGFYRETSKEEENEKYHYFFESIIDYEIPSYSNTSKNFIGRALLISSRVLVDKNFEKNSLKIVGGPFCPIRVNPILKRARYINPRYFDDFEYRVQTNSLNNNDSLYQISFTQKKGNLSGQLEISAVDFKYRSISIIEKKQSEQKEKYILYNEKGLPNLIGYKWHHSALGKNWYSTLEYVMLRELDIDALSLSNGREIENTDYVASIPSINSELVEKELSNNSVELADKLTYSLYFPKDMYENLSLESSIQSESVSSLKRVIYSLQLLPLVFKPAKYDLRLAGVSGNNLELNGETRSSTPLALSMETSLLSEKKFNVMFGASFMPFSKQNSSGMVGLNFSNYFVFNKSKIPFGVEGRLGFQVIDGKQKLGEAFLANGISIDDKSFEAGDFDVYKKFKGVFTGPGISFILPSKKPSHVYFSLQYLFPVADIQSKFLIKESKGFLFKKSAEYEPTQFTGKLDDFNPVQNGGWLISFGLGIF